MSPALRFLTSGESHGKCLNVIIEGIGANFEIDVDFINSELRARQQGKGRGGRMKIEADAVKINSGIRFSKTTGAPICFEIENKDHENWTKAMSPDKVDFNTEKEIAPKEITFLRPGHADLPGSVKYRQDDVRNILERSSARETAARVAVGALCQDILRKFGIEGTSRVLEIGGAGITREIDEKIQAAEASGDTLGGYIEVEFKGLPIGLGSHVHWDRRLDGIIAQAVMSIPAVKSVEIGLGMGVKDLPGSKVHDEIFYENGKYIRKTNNAGGIEGGMTNSEPLIVRAAMKPIPTMKTPLDSVDLRTKEPVKAHFERADVCAVEACGVVARNMVAIVLLNAFFEKFGGDSFEEVRQNYDNRFQQ